MNYLKYALIAFLLSPVAINSANKSDPKCFMGLSDIFGDCLEGGGGIVGQISGEEHTDYSASNSGRDSLQFLGSREETINNKPHHKKILEIDNKDTKQKKKVVKKEENTTKPTTKKSEAEKIREELKKEAIEAKKGNTSP